MFENICSLMGRSIKRSMPWWYVLSLLIPFQALANIAPVITSTPDTTIIEDNPYTYTITATDEDGDALTYSVIELPSFLAYNSSTQTLSGTPNNSNVGSFPVQVQVNDGVDTATQQFTLTVTNANDTPVVVTNIANQTINEDAEFTLDISVNFNDADPGDAITFTADNLPSGLTISSIGLISGAPDNTAALESPFTVTITATDKGQASVTSSFQIVVVNVNDAPQPFDDTVQVNEDTTKIADLLENDVDVDNDLQPSTLFVITAPTNGSVSVDTNTGLVSYTPNPDFAGTDTMVYRISDPGGLNGTATATFNVVNSNDPPVANNDVFNTTEDTPTSLNVLANDTDIDEGDAPQGSQIIIESTPISGSVVISNNSVEYTPNTNFTGTDSFTYKVGDNNGAFSNVAVVNVTVGPVNDIPTAGDDVAAVAEDEQVTFVIINNDSDTEDGSVDVGSIAIVNAPTNGSVAVNSDGTLTYTPNADFNGSDSLQYTITDSAGLTSLAATVSLTINPVNDAPVANNDLVNVDEDTSVDINILGNDTDIDSTTDILSTSVDITVQPTNGTLFIDTTTGVVKYTPTADFFGIDIFNYRVSDNGGLTSNTAEVQITVNAVNDTPRLANDSVTTDEDVAAVITVLSNDIDIDGTLDTATLTITQQPVSGTLSINSDAEITYSPNENFHGNDQFSYNINDNNGAASTSDATVLITIISINDAPVAVAGTSSTFEDKSVDITLVGTDVDEDSLSYSIITQPSNGTLSGNGATRTYTPNENYNGADSFTFKASDGSLESNTATVSINVIAVNDAPVAIAQTVTLNEDESIAITLTGTDIDNDELTFSLTGGEFSGTITGSTPTYTYKPADNFNGTETLLFVANDGELDSANEIVTIQVLSVNDTPTVEDQDIFVAEDGSVVVTLNASDIDEDTLTYTVENGPSNGLLTGVAPNLTYTPNENYAGSDSFNYYVNDGNVNSATATISIEVTPNADAPVADNQSVSGDEDTTINITLAASDPDGNTLTYQLVTNPIRGTLSGDMPNLVYQPSDDFNGNDSFIYKVSDGSFESNSATVTIEVNPVNDPPMAVNDQFTKSMAGVSWITLDVLQNDEDIDGDQLTLLSANADFGSVAVANNQLRYVPEDGFAGDVILNYLMSDPENQSDRALVRLTVVDNSSPEDPQIETPDDISVVATGRLTTVDLGSAVAMDRLGNIIPVELLDTRTAFPPGAHTVFWKATDAQGNSAINSQKVNVFPLVSLNSGQNIEEGQQGVVKVMLNGPAPIYPVVVPFIIEGSATNGLDFELTDTEIRINQGLTTEITFDTNADGITEGNETVVIKLGDTPYKSNESTFTGTIDEGNISPRASLFAKQNEQKRLLIESNNQTVTVYANIRDGNSTDTHTIQWLPDQRIVRTNDSSEADFEFSAEGLSAGIYSIAAKITDSHNSPQTTETQIFIEVTNSLAILGSDDSDGDLLSDSEEGYQDSDKDHIPDYLDPNSDCSVIPQKTEQQQRYLVEGETSGCLRLGEAASRSTSGGSLVDNNGSILPQDIDTNNVGGIFDFEVHGLSESTSSYAIVLPQRQPLPQDAVYRKYSQQQGWYTFVANDKNKIYSAQGKSGICPPPKADVWSEGLSVGHWCVQLWIEDGGPNDDDGVQNGMISDPGGVSVYNSSNSFPTAMADVGELTWNSSAEFDVLTNDSDSDNDSLEIITADAGLGNAEIIDGAKIRYTTLENYVGEDKVDYTISDGHGGTNSSTLTVTIKGNSAPIANDDNASTTFDKAITIDVLGNDTDVDSDALSIESASADIGTVSITSEQKLLYTPQNGFEGTAIVSYEVTDGKDASDEANLFVTVSAPPDDGTTTPPPITDNDSGGGGSIYILWILTGLVGLRRLKALKENQRR